MGTTKLAVGRTTAVAPAPASRRASPRRPLQAREAIKRIIVPMLVALIPACRGGDSRGAAPSSASPPTLPPPLPTASSAPSIPAIAVEDASPGARTWNFDSDPVGVAPPGFVFGRTGGGREGRWIVKADMSAPSGPNVLAQTDADTTDGRFPVAWATEPSLRDLELRVRCKPVSGSVDQACGVVMRLGDANNYYLSRANSLENNVRLYYVKDGHRQQIASYSGKVSSGTWHEYRVVLQGDHFEIYWDGAKVLDHRDGTFPDAGKVGLWTKADSVTLFDDLGVRAL